MAFDGMAFDDSAFDGRAFDGRGIDAVVTAAVADGLVPHLVVVVADAAGIVHTAAAGRAVVGAGAPVGVDTRFRIMSMTKIVCTTVALQLIDEGRLTLDTPVAAVLPEFGELPVLEGFDGDAPRVVAQRAQATVRHLLTHTSGLGYWFWSPELVRYGEFTGTPVAVGNARSVLRLPLLAQPGERFVYGTSTDWLGRVVETVTGTGLDTLVAQRITGPLGMRHTDFGPGSSAVADPSAGCAPYAAVHVRPSGAWRSLAEASTEPPEWCSGGHGLCSTPRDYTRFLRMMLRGGELDGVRVLPEATVEAAFQDQTGGLGFPAHIPTAAPRTADTFDMGPGWAWGWGLLVNEADLPGRRRAGSGGWAGLYNTYFVIDRRAGVCLSLYGSWLPFASRTGALRVYEDVERALYAAL